MDEEEHKPMVRSNELLLGFTLQYWNIVDMPKVSSDISLPKCYKKVETLIDQLK